MGFTVVALALLQAQSAVSLRVPATRDPGAEAVAVATRSAAPRLDGKLDDEVWSKAAPIGNFLQRDPDEGQAGTERTEARILYSDDALYIGIRAWDSQALRISAPLARRDDFPPSDWVGVLIDSYHDRRTAFEFAVNPAGVKRDVYHYNDGEVDETWNAVWDVAVSRDAQGWTAEFRIPFSQLRFARGADRRFGFDIWRKINRKSELSYWRLIPKNAQGEVSHFGDLTGFDQLTPPKSLEVAPYTLAGGSFETAVPGNPFRTGSSGRATGGADLRYGLTSNLTLSAAINPDFGQVEADPAVVNLSPTETFYADRRPFFTEGSDVFRFRAYPAPWSNEQLFYTRRIGRAPQLEADARGGFSQDVTETTILGAAKVQGKLPSGWTVGLLTALTGEENAAVVDQSGARFKDIVEPRTEYGAMRLSRDYGNGRTVIGGFATAVVRDLTPATASLRHDAYAGGIELLHRFSGDRYLVRATVMGSRVGGSPEAILATQQSSVHYYQRPGQGFATLDSGRTSLSGLGGFAEISKNAGDWLWGFQGSTRSPGLELNDAGYQTDAGRTDFLSWITRRWLTPGRVFRSASVRSNQWAQWGYDGRTGDHGIEVISNFTFRNFWAGSLWTGTQREAYSFHALEGGPAMKYPAGGWIGMSLATDQRRALRLSVNGNRWTSFDGPGHGFTGGATVAWRPSSRLDFSLGPQYGNETSSRQFIASGVVGPRTEYVVAEVQQKTVSMATRANFTFTPSLSFQLYAEPFISSGSHPHFKRVADPEGRNEAARMDVLGEDRLIRDGTHVSADFNRDGIADLDLGTPDFTVLSLRSTAVLRWEYRPASSIILVWQQDRGEETEEGQFHFGTGWHRMMGSPSRNTLVVKVSHWLSVRR